MRKRNWRHTTEDNHSTLSNWQVNVTSWVTRNGVRYNNFSKCKLFIFRKHENTIVRLWKVLQELCMQYLKLAKLKIPDPVKWHNYVLWTYRIIKFQWWRSEPKGTIYTRSDEFCFFCLPAKLLVSSGKSTCLMPTKSLVSSGYNHLFKSLLNTSSVHLRYQ